jgi:hypothetical protein
MSDREIAATFWVTVLIFALFASPKLRRPIWSLARAATQRLLLLAVLLVTVWVWGSALILERVGLWDGSHVYKTWIWIFSAGMVGVIGLVGDNHPVDAIKDSVKKNFKISALLTFVLNSNPFPLLVELILLPTATFFDSGYPGEEGRRVQVREGPIGQFHGGFWDVGPRLRFVRDISTANHVFQLGHA